MLAMVGQTRCTWVDPGTERDHVMERYMLKLEVGMWHGTMPARRLMQHQWHNIIGMTGKSASLQTPLLIANEEDGVVNSGGNSDPGPKSAPHPPSTLDRIDPSALADYAEDCKRSLQSTLTTRDATTVTRLDICMFKMAGV